MIAGILTKYIKKVKEFAKEKSAYHIIQNVKFIGTKDELILSCCDAECGITQKLKQHGTPIIGEFCVNVFSLYDKISKIKEDLDIEVKLNTKNYKLDFKTVVSKFPIQGYDPDQLYELAEHVNFKEVGQDFFDKLNSIVRMNLDDSYPIVFDGTHIYYAAPHTIVFTEEEIDILPFKTNTKIAPKIFIDTFTEIDVTENQIHLKNDNCRIFIPQVNTKAAILKNIIEASRPYTIVSQINVSELRSANGIIQSLQSDDEYGIRSVELIFEKNTLILHYQESEFIICDVKYTHPTKIIIKIPYDHLKMITGSAFLKENNYVTILLSNDNKMFVAKRTNLLFVGGLSKL